MIKIDAAVIDKLIADLRQAVRATGLKKAVIGLSGGIDSALAAALAVRALGCENVYAYSLPYKLSSLSSKEDAQITAEHLDISMESIDITAMADAYTGGAHALPHRLGNLLARLRMAVLFDKSAEQEAIVLGTSNKTEILLGYSTWFGDSASSINPLGDLYKTQVYQAARLLGLPDSLIAKVPSADLYQGQTDEGDFGYSYAKIDRLIDYLVEGGHSAEEAFEYGFDRDFINAIDARISRNEYKRAMPMIISIGQVPVNSNAQK